MNNDSISYRGEWNYTVLKRFVLNTALSKDARFLWIVLRGYVSETSPQPFPSVRTLCQVLGVSKETLAGYGRELVAAGFLEKRQRTSGGKFQSNSYTLLDPSAPWPSFPATENPSPEIPSPENPATKNNQYKEVPRGRRSTKGRGSVADAPASKPKGKKPKAEANTGPEHARFIELWCVDYEAHFGRPYKFGGGKDAKAVQRLLQSSKLSPEKLVETAKRAWTKHATEFNCKQSVTIAGFDSRFNDIMVEIGPAHDDHMLPARVAGPEEFK